MKLKEKVKKKSTKSARLNFATNGTQPATNLADVNTVITNISGKTLVFGFIPPHGKSLANGASVTIAGDLGAQLKTGGGRNWQRKVDAFNNAITDKLIQVTRNVRSIVYCAVDEGTTIAAGDFVYLDTDDVKPASAFSWNSDLATTQAGFADVFLGIALASHIPDDGALSDFPVDISPNSYYTYVADSESHEIGDTLGPKKQSGDALENQKLDLAVAASSIARCHRRDASAAASSVVTFQSAYWGNNAAGAQ